MLTRASQTGRRRGSRDEHGASALEMALVAPGFLFLIFLAVQASLFFYGRNVAIQSAREGVAQLRLAQDPAAYDQISGEVASNTVRYASTIGRESLISPTAETAYDDAAGRVRVEVSGRVISLLPFLDLTVTEYAEGPVERFEAP
ncbi:MAG: TadE/TadG family type IV pilus assembly protein [Nocardioides sp.]